MPVLVPPPQLARVTMTFIISGIPQRNVFHVFDHRGEMGPAELRSLGELFQSWAYLPNIYGAAPPVSLMCHSLASLELGLFYFSGVLALRTLRLGAFALGAFTNPANGPPVPGNSTIALEWLTGIGGPRGHGRSYICGLPSLFLREGTAHRLDPGYMSVLRDSYASLLPTLRDATDPPGSLELVVFHRDGFLGSDRVVHWFTPITGCRFVDDVLDSQRGRLPAHVHH